MNLKFQGNCFNYGKKYHNSTDCRLPKKKKNHETNMIENISKYVADLNLAAIVSEVNLISSNQNE